MKPEVTGGTKTVLLLEWDGQINQSGFVQQFPWSPCLFFLSPVLVQAEVCAAVALAVWLLEQLSHSVLVGSSTSEIPQASVCPEEHISSFSVVLLSLKTAFQKAKRLLY